MANIYHKHKIKDRDVVFTLSSNKIITREVNYPDLPQKKLAPLIRMNSDDYFPVDLSKYTMSFSILERFEQDMEKMVRTNTVVIPTEIVSTYTELAKKCRLRVRGISYAENAMMNYAMLVDDDKPYMVVDLGGGRTSIAIVNEGKIVLNRTFNNGVKSVIELIRKRYGVGYDRAVQIATEKTFLKRIDGSEDGFTIKLTSFINLIVNGIARLMDYYSNKNNAHVESIYLTGLGASVSGLSSYINSYFGVDTRILDDIKMIHSKDIEYLSKKNLYANAVGTVYSDVNLLPAEFIRYKKSQDKKRINIELIVLLFVLCISMLYFPIKRNLEMAQEKASLEAKLEECKKVIPVVAKRDELKLRAEFLDRIENIYSVDVDLVKVFEQMEAMVPKDVSYKLMSSGKEGMVISCIAKDKNTVVNFLMQIKAIEVDAKKVFADAFIASVVSKDKQIDDKDNKGAKNNKANEKDVNREQEYTFTITCTYNKEVSDEQ